LSTALEVDAVAAAPPRFLHPDQEHATTTTHGARAETAANLGAAEQPLRAGPAPVAAERLDEPLRHGSEICVRHPARPRDRGLVRQKKRLRAGQLYTPYE